MQPPLSPRFICDAHSDQYRTKQVSTPLQHFNLAHKGTTLHLVTLIRTLLSRQFKFTQMHCYLLHIRCHVPLKLIRALLYKINGIINHRSRTFANDRQHVFPSMTSSRMEDKLEFRGNQLLESLAVPPRIVAAFKKGSSAHECTVLHNRSRLFQPGWYIFAAY